MSSSTVDLDVLVPMRDGAKLRANIFRPAGDGRHPVLLARLPYGKDATPTVRRPRHGRRSR